MKGRAAWQWGQLAVQKKYKRILVLPELVWCQVCACAPASEPALTVVEPHSRHTSSAAWQNPVNSLVIITSRL